MSDHDVRMILLSTDDLDASIAFYTQTLGMTLKFRDGGHFAAIDGGSVPPAGDEERARELLADYRLAQYDLTVGEGYAADALYAVPPVG